VRLRCLRDAFFDVCVVVGCGVWFCVAAPDANRTPTPSAAQLDAERAECESDQATSTLLLSLMFGAVVALLSMVVRASAECGCIRTVRFKLLRDVCIAIGLCIVYFLMLWNVVFIIVGAVLIADSPEVKVRHASHPYHTSPVQRRQPLFFR
jgi:hypothetical protein